MEAANGAAMGRHNYVRTVVGDVSMGYITTHDVTRIGRIKRRVGIACRATALAFAVTLITIPVLFGVALIVGIAWAIVASMVCEPVAMTTNLFGSPYPVYSSEGFCFILADH